MENFVDSLSLSLSLSLRFHFHAFVKCNPAHMRRPRFDKPQILEKCEIFLTILPIVVYSCQCYLIMHDEATKRCQCCTRHSNEKENSVYSINISQDGLDNKIGKLKIEFVN